MQKNTNEYKYLKIKLYTIKTLYVESIDNIL